MTPFCVLNTKINALQIRTLAACANETTNVYVVVNFYFSIVFGTVIYANEFETKEKKITWLIATYACPFSYNILQSNQAKRSRR